MGADAATTFEQPSRDVSPAAQRGVLPSLALDIEGFEGPLDVLLALAREQKVDLARVSMIQLADRYLEFVAEAEALSIELAGDYLVMAADLALIRAKLLLAKAQHRGEDLAPSEDELEEASRRRLMQLRRLEAMREAGARLMGLSHLGRDRFARGRPELDGGGPRRSRPTEGWLATTSPTFADLILTYARIASRRFATAPIEVRKRFVIALADGLRRLKETLAVEIGWRGLFEAIPEQWRGSPEAARCAVAAIFVAGLELARQGRALLRQVEDFGAIEVSGVERDQDDRERD